MNLVDKKIALGCHQKVLKQEQYPNGAKALLSQTPVRKIFKSKLAFVSARTLTDVHTKLPSYLSIRRKSGHKKILRQKYFEFSMNLQFFSIINKFRRIAPPADRIFLDRFFFCTFFSYCLCFDVI